MNKKIMATMLALGIAISASGVAYAYDAAAQGGNASDSFDYDYEELTTATKTAEEESVALITKKAKANAEKKNAEKSQENIKAASVKLPVVVYGDDVQYDSDSGNFKALGNVRIYQGEQVLKTESAIGNTKTGNVFLQKGALIKDSKGTTTAKWARYNFNTKDGELKEISGTSNYDLYDAPHAYIEDGLIKLDEGATTSRCPAVEHTKCLSIRAKSVEVYPNDKIIAHGVSVYVKGKKIYTRDTWVNEFSDDEQSLFPSIGYDSTFGWEFKYHFVKSLGKDDTLYFNPKFYSHSDYGYKPNYEYKHDERNFYVTARYGWYEDDDDWIKKHGDYGIYYKYHYLTDAIPLQYSLFYNKALWEEDDVKSWRTSYGLYLKHDNIYFGKDKDLYLALGAGVKKLDYEISSSGSKTITSYNASLHKKFNDRLSVIGAYYWTDYTYDLFDYDDPDMAHELRGTVNLQLDRTNKLTYIARFDEGENELYSNKWRLTHDFGCFRVYLQYEDYKDEDSDSDEWKIKYDLYRW